MASIVLPSSRFISELSNDVKISNENINSLAHIVYYFNLSIKF